MSSEPLSVAVRPGDSGLNRCDPVAFRHACARFVTGVAIVSVLDRAGQPDGMTVNSFTSVSLDPLLYLVCIDHRSKIMALFEVGAPIAINILGEDQQALSVKFARTGEDRFGALSWSAGVTGAPLIPGTIAMIEGLVREMIVAGDHTILITEVFGTDYSEGRPLVYFNSRYDRLGEHSL